MTGDWRVFRGDGSVHDGIDDLPDPPPWRDFSLQRRSGERYWIGAEARDRVNAALLLRRPLLVTGRPGTGKSALAYAVARELGLGRVLHWPVTSRTTARDGLYQYDAIRRLQDSSWDRPSRTAGRRLARVSADRMIGEYITLGPLGTAFLSAADARPRVVLIDEIDKGDADLPYDLLNVFEEGRFDIAELDRGGSRPAVVRVRTDDPGTRALVRDAQVQCGAFPFVVLTSNGDRVFPPAFLRRCVRLHLKEPNPEELRRIVEAHLGRELDQRLLDRFEEGRSSGMLATDQLLNAVYLTSQGVYDSGWTLDELADAVLQNLEPLE